MVLLKGLLGWAKTRAGVVNLSLYVIIGIVVFLGYLRWEKALEERATFEEANKALTTQITELSNKLLIEREVADRLLEAKSVIREESETIKKELEESKDEDGHIDTRAVAAILCANGYAEPAACQKEFAPVDAD